MLRKVSNASLAASIASATVSPSVAVATTPVIVTYTTVDPHNLYVGARVTITGLSSSDSNSPNVTRQSVYRLDGPNSFSVILPTTTPYASRPTITLTGGAGVYGTMISVNSALSASKLQYSEPVLVDRPTFYNYIFPTVEASPTGTGINLEWTAIGVAFPSLITYRLERVTGTNTSVVLSSNSQGTYLDENVATVGSATTFTYRVSAANTKAINSITTSAVSLYVANISAINVAPVAAVQNAIFISWPAPTTNAVLTSYELDRLDITTTSPVPSWTSLVPESGPILPSQTTYTDLTAVDGINYTYRVRAAAYYETGGTVYSNYNTSSPIASYYISDPVSITATAAAGVANRIDVSWSAVAANPATVTYELQEAVSAAGVTYGAWTTVQSTTATSFARTTAISSYYYKYRVRAINSQFTSNYIEGTAARAYYLADPLPAPIVTNAAATNSALTISAANNALPSITGYNIRRSADSGANWTNIGATNYSITLPYTDSTTATNTAYIYSVKATNGQLTTGNWSATSASITSYSVPNAPAGLATAVVSSASTTVSLSWFPATVNASSPSITLYKLERAETSDFSGTTAVVVNDAILPGPVSYVDTVASATNTYYYRVSAINSVGTGPASPSTYRVGVPTSLTAAPVAATANVINITWNAVTVTPSVTAYVLEEATSADNVTYGAWTTATSTASTSFSRTGATSGTYYKYRVRAFSGKYSAYSTESTTRAYYLTDPLPAPTVTNAAAAPGVYDLVISATNAAIPTITGYNIQRALSSSPTTFTSIGATNYSITLPYTDTTPAANTAYVYQVKATNGQLTTANWSPSSISVTTFTVPNAPTSLDAVSGTTGSNISISWTAATVPAGSPAVSNYKLERSETSNFTGTTAVVVTSAISSAATTYNDTGRSLSVTYYYRLSAINSIGTGPVSNVDSAVITLIPGAASLSISSATTTFNTGVTMTATTNANRSVKLQSSTDNATWSDVVTQTANASGNTTFTRTITTNNTTVNYFRIVVSQDAIYTQTTSGSVNTTTTANSFNVANYDYSNPNVDDANFLTVTVTDVNGTAVSGAAVQFSYRRYGQGEAHTSYGAAVTTDANGRARIDYGVQYESINWGYSVSKGNYTTKANNTKTGGGIATFLVDQTTGYVTQDGYGSYAENSSWGARAGGDGGYMYSGWWSTAQGRQAGAAYWSSMGTLNGYNHSWARINNSWSISGVFINITRIGGTGGSGMNISYGVHTSASKIANFNSLPKWTNLLWGATNRPAYSAGNNRDYNTDITALAGYFRGGNGGKGLTFGHTTEAATQDNYAVLNNNVELQIIYTANPTI
jgi:hypothetical protein